MISIPNIADVNNSWNNFQEVRSFLKTSYVEALLRESSEAESEKHIRVHLQGRLDRIILVPHSSLRYTEHAIVYLIDDQDVPISFCVANSLFTSSKVIDIRNASLQLNAKNRTLNLEVSNLLVARQRVLFDSLSMMTVQSRGTAERVEMDLLKKEAIDLVSIDELPPGLRYFTIATLPELRIVHFRNTSAINSSRKIHQPIVFRCDHGSDQSQQPP
jgi:hypothetical protein